MWRGLASVCTSRPPDHGAVHAARGPCEGRGTMCASGKGRVAAGAATGGRRAVASRLSRPIPLCPVQSHSIPPHPAYPDLSHSVPANLGLSRLIPVSSALSRRIPLCPGESRMRLISRGIPLPSQGPIRSAPPSRRHAPTCSGHPRASVVPPDMDARIKSAHDGAREGAVTGAGRVPGTRPGMSAHGGMGASRATDVAGRDAPTTRVGCAMTGTSGGHLGDSRAETVAVESRLSHLIPLYPGESRMILMSRGIPLSSRGVLSACPPPRVVMPALTRT